MTQVDFRGPGGQAFTDMYGNFSGRLSDIVDMGLKDNFHRAIFMSSLNAVMRYLGLVDKTVHCRDNEPRKLSQELIEYVERNYSYPKIAFIGFQRRMVEASSQEFELRVTDTNCDNIGKEKSGVMIHGPKKTKGNLSWCDMDLATGTTIVNVTFSQFRLSKPVIFYGVTRSGVVRLLGIDHFSCCGH